MVDLPEPFYPYKTKRLTTFDLKRNVIKRGILEIEFVARKRNDIFFKRAVLPGSHIENLLHMVDSFTTVSASGDAEERVACVPLPTGDDHPGQIVCGLPLGSKVSI